jgi:hypothetical protein
MSSPMVFDEDVQIKYTAPGYEYNPQETDGVWHEDREIAGVLYRATNATYTYDTLTWSQPNTSQPSYCMVHYTDGSIRYYYMPKGQTTWTTWLSTDVQEYYAVNYGLEASDMTGAINTPALNNAVSDIVAAGGGILRLPAGTFQLDGAITVDFGGASVGLIIAGFSAVTRLIQNSDNSHIFDVSHTNSSSALVIKDLTLQYASMMPVGVIAAVNLSHCENVYCERVYFQDCPASFQDDSNCLQCGLFECTIRYDLKTGGEEPAPVGSKTMVYLNGSDDFVTGCAIGQEPENSTGPSGCTGIAISSNNNARFITDTHFADFATGMTITEGVNEVYCSGVLIEAQGTALIIRPTGNSGTILDLHFTNCTFAASLKGNAGGTSGVIISTNGNTPINVAGIYFSNCSVFGFGNAGIEIDSGQNIVITGGQYSSNGQSPTESYNAAGIAVLGGNDITITGVDCSGVNGGWSLAVPLAPAQPYGICVAGVVSDASIVGCNLTGNGTNGLYLLELAAATPGKVYVRDCDATGYSAWNVALNIASTATSVQVTNCPGYNDSLTVAVTTSTPPTTAVFHASDHGYYGPATFCIAVNTMVTAVKINGVATGLKVGAFFLGAGQSGEIDYSGLVPPGFVMLGQ